jgi:hypothetical protein
MDPVHTPGRLRSQPVKVHTPACHDCHDDTTSLPAPLASAAARRGVIQRTSAGTAQVRRRRARLPSGRPVAVRLRGVAGPDRDGLGPPLRGDAQIAAAFKAAAQACSGGDPQASPSAQLRCAAITQLCVHTGRRRMTLTWARADGSGSRLTVRRHRSCPATCGRSGWLVRKSSCRWKNAWVIDPAEPGRGCRD